VNNNSFDEVRTKASVRPASARKVAAAVEAFFVRNRTWLSWVHAAMFLVFLGIILVPVFLPDPPGNATPLTHYTTFTNYLLWGLWFPLVFMSVIFTGRSWCGLLCPMGAAAEKANAYGPKFKIPSWLSWEGTPVVSFLIVTILGQTVGVRDHPEAAAEVFGGTMLAAIIIGWLFGSKKRARCRHACPIGLLLGVFSRLGAVEFAPWTRKSTTEGYTDRGICPTLIDISRKTESRHCIECFRCVNPTAKGGVHLEFRKPGKEIERIRDHHANPVEVWFLFLGTGIALGGFLWLVLPIFQKMRQSLGVWSIHNGLTWIGQPGPAWLMSVHPERNEIFLWLDFVMITGFMTGCMVLLAVVLAAFTSCSSALAGRAGGDGTFGSRFTELGYQYTPVAMVSLIIGLGGKLFEPIAYTPLGIDGVHGAKGLLFVIGLLWSIRLGERILARQGVAASRRWLPLLPGLIGTLAVGLGWWPAIFGLMK
jgi:polyferredoxin